MFELWPKISIPESEFAKKHNITKAQIDFIKSKILKRDGGKCCGCKISNETRKLQLHVYEENEKNPLKSIFLCLCPECHYIEHIDKAIEKDYVKLVNSSFKQSELVEICRSKTLSQNINEGNIEVLNKEPALFLEELRAGSLGRNRIKVVFSPKKYPW